MTVTDQLKIIDDKIKANQAQYDLDRLAAKISALPSGESRKYEYLTGEDLGYQLSVLEQKKIDHSPLCRVFNKGLDKGDQKEGLFKRLKNIEDKNEELPNALSEAIKASKNANSESNFYYDSDFKFRRLYTEFEKFKKMTSLESKRSELIDFYKLFRDFKDFDPPTPHNDDDFNLIISNEEINDIMQIVQALEDSNILLKGVTKTIENRTKEQKEGFLSMLLGTLRASLLGNLLAGKGFARAGYGNEWDF